MVTVVPRDRRSSGPDRDGQEGRFRTDLNPSPLPSGRPSRPRGDSFTGYNRCGSFDGVRLCGDTGDSVNIGCLEKSRLFSLLCFTDTPSRLHPSTNPISYRNTLGITLSRTRLFYSNNFK